MKAKRNKKPQLPKNSNLYFSIGLCWVLGLAYAALEWKTFEKSKVFTEKLNVADGLEMEVIPIIKLPKPPKPRMIPPIIELVPDDDESVETPFEIIGPDSEEPLMKTTDIPDEIEVIEETIPIALVEEAPVFPGCETVEDKKACFQEMMFKHIRKNFHYPELAKDMGLQGRVNVLFTIQKDGSIGHVKMRGPHKVLEGEAERIISKLPTMVPGKQRGRAVNVPFSIPITFRLN